MCRRKEIEYLVEQMNSYDIAQMLHKCVDPETVSFGVEQKEAIVGFSFDTMKFRELLPKYLTGEHT